MLDIPVLGTGQDLKRLLEGPNPHK